MQSPTIEAVDILANAFAEIPGDPHETEPRGAEILEHAGAYLLSVVGIRSHGYLLAAN